MKKTVTILYFILCLLPVLAQAPDYDAPNFITENPDSLYQNIGKYDSTGLKTGYWSEYLVVQTVLFDLDKSGRIPIRYEGPALMNFRSHYKKDKREGNVEVFVMIQDGKEQNYVRIMDQQYQDGLPNGYFKEYNLKGDLIQETPYENGIIHGTLISYPSIGPNASPNLIKQEFVQNVRNGKYSESLGGKILRSRIYENDMLHGPFQDFYPDGSLKGEGQFVQGKIEGMVKHFAPNGELKEETLYQNGLQEGHTRMYYPGNQLMFECMMEGGLQNGFYRYYHENGQLWIDMVYKKGKPWTVLANYDKDGKPMDKGSLKRGNGTVHYYAPDGTLRETVDYIKGEEVTDKP